VAALESIGLVLRQESSRSFFSFKGRFVPPVQFQLPRSVTEIGDEHTANFRWIGSTQQPPQRSPGYGTKNRFLITE
jgi:hypothetical protein